MPTRILLIEDNPGDALIFREKLNDSDIDYELVHTERLQEGLDLIAQSSFDIILCDLSLPDAHGLEAVIKVRRAAPDKPLIILTGLDDANAAAKARTEGAIDYLVKWYQDGPSLARYIRYAIAQGQMIRDGRMGKPGSAARQPAASRKHPAGASDPEPAPSAEPAASPEPGGATRDDLAHALDAVHVGIAVVGPSRRLLFSNRSAREWIGSAGEYPWPLSAGEHVVSRGDLRLEQTATETTWAGRPATAITLRPAVEAGQTPEVSPLAVQIAQAAYAFSEAVERRSAWMTDLMRSAVDLEQHGRTGIASKPQLVNLVECVNFAVREQHTLALQTGMAVRVKAAREKVSAMAERSLVDVLLRRLLFNALLTAESEGIDIELRIEGSMSKICVEWEQSPMLWNSLAPAARVLARSVTEHIVGRMGGTSSHEQVAGREVVIVNLPARTVPGADS